MKQRRFSGLSFLASCQVSFATDVEEIVRSLDSLLTMCYVQRLSAEDRYLMMGYGLSVPPYVRQALFSRAVDNDDLLPQIRKPVLITQGTEDAIVKSIVVNKHKAGLPHAQIHMVTNVSHAPFWDDAPGFNQRLREFSTSS